MKKLTLVVALLLSTCAPAHADYVSLYPSPLCTGYADGAAILADKYGEMLAESTVQDGIVFQFFANPVNGSFTVVQMSPDGTTMCAVAYGQADKFVGEGI